MTATTLHVATRLDAAVPDLRRIPLTLLDEPPHNRHINEAALEELADSIRQRGVLEPILVRPKGDGRYEVVAGVRRVRGSRLAEQDDIPAQVQSMTDIEAREAQLVENLQREDLHPLDEAESYQALLTADSSATVEHVAARMSKPPTHVYRRLRFLRLIPPAQSAFRADILTAAHAERLAGVPPEQQPEAFARCFYSLLSSPEDGQGITRENLAPLTLLDEWLRERVALDVRHEDTRRLLPELATQVADDEADGATVLMLSTLHFHTDQREPKPILARSWMRAEGKQRCPHARPGVIMLGDRQGERLQVCVAKKACTKHWKRPAKPDAAATARAREAAQAADERREREQRERAFWTETLQPALLKAIAEKAATMKVTKGLIRAAAEAITYNVRQLTTLCGPSAALTADGFAQLLVVAMALEDSHDTARLSARAKSVGVNVKALRKTLEAKPTPVGYPRSRDAR